MNPAFNPRSRRVRIQSAANILTQRKVDKLSTCTQDISLQLKRLEARRGCRA